MDRCYSCADIAARYGVGKHTVWSWIRSKKLSAIKTGKCYAIRPEDLTDFEESRKTK